MTTIAYNESTCDRCRAVERRPVDAVGLPEGWIAVSIEDVHADWGRREFCPKCSAGIEEAMRPLQRVRSGVP